MILLSMILPKFFCAGERRRADNGPLENPSNGQPPRPVQKSEDKKFTKPPKACRWFGQELFATYPQGEKPWGVFEPKGNEVNEGASGVPVLSTSMFNV